MHSGSPLFRSADNSNTVPTPMGNGDRPPATHHTCGGACAEIPPLFQEVQLAPGSVVENMLKAGEDPNSLDAQNRPPLHHAAMFKRYDAAVALIAAGADINFSHSDQHITAVHVAARVGCTEILKLLLAAGARHDRKDQAGFRPLHHAVFYGRSEVAVKMLLEKGCDIEAKTSQGLNHLALAAMVRMPRMAHLLLEAGARVMARGDTGLTALHLATAHGASVVAHVLLAAGADPEAGDDDGDTPLDVLGTGEGMDGSNPTRENSEATWRVIRRASAYRSRAWLWPPANDDCRSTSVDGGGGGGSGTVDAKYLAIPSTCLLVQSENGIQTRRRHIFAAVIRCDGWHGCSIR